MKYGNSWIHMLPDTAEDIQVKVTAYKPSDLHHLSLEQDRENGTDRLTITLPLTQLHVLVEKMQLALDEASLKAAGVQVLAAPIVDSPMPRIASPSATTRTDA